jgi:hypothetical protein
VAGVVVEAAPEVEVLGDERDDDPPPHAASAATTAPRVAPRIRRAPEVTPDRRPSCPGESQVGPGACNQPCGQHPTAGPLPPVDVTLERAARTACAQRVQVTQAGRPILNAQVWSVAPVPGLEHHQTSPPAVPGPEELLPIEALMPDAPPPVPFWDNVESRPIEFSPLWPPKEPLPPIWRSWTRLRPTATFDDPWLDAARSLILFDVQSWPAAHRHHTWRDPPFIAPSLDLYVAFHEPAGAEPWAAR